MTQTNGKKISKKIKKIKEIGMTLAAIVIIPYALGYLINGFYLSYYGIQNTNLFYNCYVFIGIIFLILSFPIFAIAYEFNNTKRKEKQEVKLLRIGIYAYGAACVSILLLQVLSPLDKKYFTEEINFLQIVFVVGFMLVIMGLLLLFTLLYCKIFKDNFREFLGLYKSLLFIVFLIMCCFFVAGKPKENTVFLYRYIFFILFIYITTCAIYFIYKKDTYQIRYFRIYTGAVILIWILFYAYNIYGALPVQSGGGEMQKVEIIVNNEKLESILQRQIYLLEKTENTYIFFSKETKNTIEVNKQDVTILIEVKE